MAEKKPKKEFSATRKLFNSILGGKDDNEASVDWEGGYKTEVRDHGLTKAKHKMEKKSGNKKKKKAAITRLKKNVENMSLVKPKPKKKNVLIKSAPKPKKGKEFNQGGMSKEELGKHNFMALNSLYDVLDGKGPSALDIASSKKVAEDKVTSGLEEFKDAKGFDYEPKDKGYEIEGLSLTDKSGDPDYEEMRLKQNRAAESISQGDSEALINQAAAQSGVELDDDRLDEAERMLAHGDLMGEAESIKKKPYSSWLDSEKFLIALAGLAAPLVGYALGGYEGALHGAKGTAEGIKSYGQSQIDLKKAEAKARGKDGKTVSLTMKDENGEMQDYLFKYDQSGDLQPVINPINGKIATGSVLAEARILSEGKVKLKALEEEGKTKRIESTEGGKKERILITEGGKGTRQGKDIAAGKEKWQAELAAKRQKWKRDLKLAKKQGKHLPVGMKKRIDTLGSKIESGYDAAVFLDERKNEMLAAFKSGNRQLGIKLGEAMLRDLQSLKGSDAITGGEASRIGGFIENKLFNWKSAGSVFGRDPKQFIRQVNSTLKSAFRAIDRMESRFSVLQTGSVPRLSGGKARTKQKKLPPGQTKIKVKTNSQGQFTTGGVLYQVIKVENGITHFERAK